MQTRTRSWRRKKTYHKANRKYKIAKARREGTPTFGRFRKGKLHCSCPMCTFKTNKRKGFACGIKARDLRQPQMYPEFEFEIKDIDDKAEAIHDFFNQHHISEYLNERKD